MTSNFLKLWACALTGVLHFGLSCTATSAATIVDFNSLAFTSSDYENGANLLPTDSSDRTFTAGSATFNNYYASPYWEGWSYSKVTDNANYGDSGYLHEFGAITGGGVVSSQTGAAKAVGDTDASSTYAVSFGMDYYITAPMISFATPQVVSGAYFTNTAYAYHAIKEGNSYANAFKASDWFRLTITGYNNSAVTGTKEFYLASGGSVVNNWQWVDLSSLGNVSSLAFNLTSSDNSTYSGVTYMNTPAYFAMDNLTLSSAAVPEPGSIILLLSGLAAMAWRWQRRKR